ATLQTALTAAPDLVRLGRDAQGPIKDLRPTARNLEAITKKAKPILDLEDERAIRDQLWFIQNWALAVKGRDSLGHFVGANLTFDASIIQSALDGIINNSNPPAAHTDHRRAAHRSALRLPALRLPTVKPTAPAGLVQGLQRALTPLITKVVGGTSATVNGA